MITYEDFRDKRREYAFTKSVSNNPKDQDAARKIRTQMDYDDLKKQIGSKKKPQLPANAVVEGLGASMAVTAGLNAVGNIAKAYGASQAAKGAIVGGALSGAGSVVGGALNYAASRNKNKKSDSKKKKVKEEKDAFKYVLAKLKAKHGDGVLTKGDKMPQPSAAQKKKNAAIRAKRAKEDGRDATEKASDGRYSDRYSNRGSD